MGAPERMHWDLKRMVDESYDVVVGRDIVPLIGSEIAERYGNRQIMVVTDKNVNYAFRSHDLVRQKGHADRVVDALREAGVRDVYLTELEPGEASKDWAVAGRLVKTLSDHGFSKDDLAIAVGGGMVTDLTGFAASVYCRSMPYGSVLSTLLAAVDAGMGGKTGVDLRGAKNKAGRIEQPRFVWIDTAMFDTLHPAQYASGIAEVVKYGVIADPNILTFLEDHMGDLVNRVPDVVNHIVQVSADIKRRVVQEDSQDRKGLRNTLNFGHTIGHPIESDSVYLKIGHSIGRTLPTAEYKLLHGEAISMGMNAAMLLAQEYGFSHADRMRVLKLLERANLPAWIPQEMSLTQILAGTKGDKKAQGRKPAYTLPSEPGKMIPGPKGTYTIPIEDDKVMEALMEIQIDPQV